MITDREMERFFQGDELYGNDFSSDDIREWHEDEKEGYANLGAKHSSTYRYGYHAINRALAFDRAKIPNDLRVLAFGAAYGDELLPIAEKISWVTIIDPSDTLRKSEAVIDHVHWIKPNALGDLVFDDCSFDLVTCFGVLHHIPNVEFVLGEIHRVLRPGGLFFLREPIVSMGDWRFLRQGLTKRERGIPRKVLHKFVTGLGFEVHSEKLCVFAPLAKTVCRLGLNTPVYNHKFLTRLDIWFSDIFSFNSGKYHRQAIWEKFAPSCVSYVLAKPF